MNQPGFHGSCHVDGYVEADVVPSLGPIFGLIGLLGGGFNDLLFLPLPGEMIQFDKHIFQLGWFNHLLAS